MGLLSHLSWRDPQWLLLALYPWVYWTVRALFSRRGGRGYAEPGLLAWARAGRAARFRAQFSWRHIAMALAWVLFALAAAGPRIALTDYGLAKRNETQVMAVIDLSRSMTARDVAPSRLERAKLELDDLLSREERLRVGIVVYAAKPHLMIPPTDDKPLVRHDLRLLRYGLLPTEGSNLPGAIAFAAKQFYPGASARALLLVTDGELPTVGAAAEARLDDAVTRLAQQGVRVYALGIGTLGGAPLAGPDGNWLRYHGQAVVTRLHADRLRRLALLGNGRYATVSDTDSDWQTLYDEGIRYLHVGDSRDHRDKLIEWRELYGWCLVPALVFFLLAYIEPRRGLSTMTSLLWLALIAIGMSAHPGVARAASALWQERAYRAYAGRSYLEAQKEYARVPSYVGRMGEGSSAYRLGKYRLAIGLFTQAVLDANNDSQRARAIFNLANSHYQLTDYGAAVALYRQVLRYHAGDRAAQTNLSFAIAMQKEKRRIREEGGNGRSGPGPRSARPPKGARLNGGSLGFEPEPRPAESGSGTLVGSSQIGPGFFRSRPAIRSVAEHKDLLWHYAVTPPERIVLEADSLHVDEAILWKRIFEAEEGIPVPVKTPKKVPGARPW